MKYSPQRRTLLARVGAVALPSVASSVPTAQLSPLAFAPAAFDVIHQRALLWVSTRVPVQLRVRWRSVGNPTWNNGPTVDLNAQNDTNSFATLDALPADQTIEYRWVDAKHETAISETCRFHTPPMAPKLFRFVFSADLEEKYKPFSIFDAMAQMHPDFCLLLGDTIYADVPKAAYYPAAAHYRRKYSANRSDAALQRFLSSHATFAIWDDHEIENNCNRTHPALALAQQVYREYWPCASVTRDGLYRQFDWGGVRFILLDTRSYRSPQTDADDAQKTMLGAAQKSWFKAALKSSSAPFQFVVTSVPFQGGGADTWGNYKTERAEIERFIRAEKISGVIFLCGDYHLARDWTNPRAGYREFMAGPLASFTKYAQDPASRDRYAKSGTFHYGDGFNFALVEVDARAERGMIEWRDAKGATLGGVTFAP